MTKRALILGLVLFALLPVSVSSAAPDQRLGHRMIYDPVGQQIILYGGAVWDDQYIFYDELWSYDTGTNTWSEIETVNMPPPRFNAMVTYIPGRHQLFLFGGYANPGRMDDTWIYDFESSTWTELQPRDTPSPRSDSSIAYDPENDVMVLFSGYRQDEVKTRETWVYSFEDDNWIMRDSENAPLHQYGHYMIYAQETAQLLMYPGHWSIVSGGATVSHGYGGNVWEYDSNGDQWTEHESTSIPPRRYWGNVAYDSNRIVMFGGHGATEFDDTWTYDIDTGEWEQASGDTRPAKRGSSNMAYDPEYDVFVMFGGIDQTGSSLGDTWILDAETLTWSMAEDTPVPEESTGFAIPGFPAWTTMGSILLVVAYWTRRNHGYV